VLKSKGKKVGIRDVTFQALRRTFVTQVRGIVTVKDAQTASALERHNDDECLHSRDLIERESHSRGLGSKIFWVFEHN
jgi:hypothetical protein